MNRWKLHIRMAVALRLRFRFPGEGGRGGTIRVRPFIVDAWSTEEGLPQSSVISVIQTQDGYLWLGTLNGLVRFDGNQFTVFDENNTPGLNSDRIVYLFEDSRTNLWIGTDTGTVAMAKDGRITDFQIGGAGHEGRLLYAFEDSKGIIWFYTADGRTSRYQDGKMSTDSNPLAISGGVGADPALGEDGIFHPRSIEQLFGAMQNEPCANSGRAIKVERHPRKFIRGGNTIVTSACEDSDGNLIVGTQGEGVFWMSADGKYRQISTEQGLSIRLVLSLCLDREGNLWVGTDGGGLDRIKRKIFNTPTEPHPWVAQSISEDAHGGLWAAFNAHGVSYWFTNSVQDFGVGRGSNAWTVLVDRNQDVWVGTRGEGLFQFQANHFQPAPGAESLGPQIFALFEDRGGQLWAGTHEWSGALGRNGLENLHDARWPRGSRHRRRCRRQSLDGNREPRACTFSRPGN